MKKAIDNFLIFIIIILMIIIFVATVYFCLDVFEIITVPPKYSIAKLFKSQIEVIANGENLYDIIPEVNEEKSIIVVESEETSKVQEQTEDIEERLEQLQNERNEQNNYVIKSQIEDTNKFYYNQLDEYAKIIYTELDKNIDKLKTGTYTVDYGLTFNDLLQDENNTEVLNNSFQLAINALTFDNPDLFYIDVTKMYLLTEITTRAFSKTYRVTIGGNGNSYLADEFLTEGSVDVAIDSVEKVKNNIVNLASGNDIDKMRIVHNYLIDNTEYDVNAGSMIYNIYGTLMNGKSVCEGYARSFKYILDDLGIPCIIVCGIGKNSEGKTESHAWNYVQINGVWYAIDVTWDDPLIRGNGTITDDIRYSYFLKGSNKFFEDHFEDGNIVGDAQFRYPEINGEDY